MRFDWFSSSTKLSSTNYEVNCRSGKCLDDGVKSGLADLADLIFQTIITVRTVLSQQRPPQPQGFVQLYSSCKTTLK